MSSTGSHIVSIKLGTVTLLCRCGLRVHERWDGPALVWRCHPHAPRRCPAPQASLSLHLRVCPLLDRVDHVSRLQAHPGTAKYAQSGKVHVSYLHNPCVWRRIVVRRSSPLPYSATSLLPYCWSPFLDGIFPQHVAAVLPANKFDLSR